MREAAGPEWDEGGFIEATAVDDDIVEREKKLDLSNFVEKSHCIKFDVFPCKANTRVLSELLTMLYFSY